LEIYNNHHFDVKLVPEFFDAAFIICITFPDNPEEGSVQVLKVAVDGTLLLLILK
jgi:hypothetical protein